MAPSYIILTHKSTLKTLKKVQLKKERHAKIFKVILNVLYDNQWNESTDNETIFDFWYTWWQTIVIK